MANRLNPAVAVAVIVLSVTALAQQPSLELAERLDEAGNCGQAESVYQAVLRAHSSMAALNNFGNHYLRCNQPEKAREIFERLLRLDPGHANANLQMARLELAARQPSRALALLERVANPDTEIRLEKAEALAATGRRADAKRTVEEIGKAARDPRYLNALGMLCARLEFYGEAEDAFERVLEADPGDADVLFNLGAAAARAGHYDRARSAFAAFLKIKPDDPGALYELGRMEAASGDYQRAIYFLARAQQMEPRRPDVDLALARATAMGGYYGDSIAAYDKYLALRPDDENARRDRALVEAFTRAGHDEGAKSLAQWVEQHPNDATGHYDLALAEGQDHPDVAMEEAVRAIALNPRFGAALFYRAWLLEQSGNYEASLRDAKAAVATGAPSARSLDLVGLNELNLSRAAEAEPVLRKALALAPDDANIVFHLGRCLAELGRHDEARLLMARFQKLNAETGVQRREQPGIVEAATLPERELARRVVAEYREGIAANPNDAGLRLRLGKTLIAAGNIDDAEKTFGELLAMSPSAEICRDAGSALLAAERYTLAAEFLGRAARQIPGAAIDLAVAELYASGPGAALTALDSAPQAAESGGEHVVRAAILDATGKRSEAASEIRQAIDRGVANPRLISTGALLLVRFGQARDALQFVERAIAQSTDDRLARQTRVAILVSLGRLGDAEAAAKEIENRWPEWDAGYVTEAMVLEKQSRPADARLRIGMAESLGARGPAIDCARNRAAASSGGAACACDDGIWSVLAGCGAARDLTSR